MTGKKLNFMNNKIDGMNANIIAIDEFKKLKNKQGENKMTAKFSNNQNMCSEIKFENGVPTGVIYATSGFTGNVSLHQPKNPYWPTKVIENNRTIIVYFENGSKRVVTCSEEDEFNKEFGFLLALAHEVFGSKDKYRTMYTKKVDKKAYPKMKNNKTHNNENQSEEIKTPKKIE